MVRGAVLQLAAIGEQNAILCGDPQMSFFIQVYRRHTNFTYEDIRNFFVGEATFGQKFYCLIDKIGDLMQQLYLVLTLPTLENIQPAGATQFTQLHISWINAVGHALIRNCEIQIGDVVVDKHYGLWMEIWSELNIDNNKRQAYNLLVGKHNINRFTNMTQMGEVQLDVPLQFWFCRNIESALPLIALQRQEVRINFEFAPADELITTYIPGFSPSCPIKDCYLLTRYYFLDSSERKLFARKKHQYLITQLQIEDVAIAAPTPVDAPPPAIGQPSRLQPVDFHMDIPFNHPVKEIVWVVQRPDSISATDPVTNTPCYWNSRFNFSNAPFPNYATTIIGTPSDLNTMLLSNFYIEGMDYFRYDFNSRYFRIIQPYMHHIRVPVRRYIYDYSFAVKPGRLQPSGTYNFSKIDHRYLKLFLNPENSSANPNNEYIINVFAVNYNILNIYNGVGTVEFIA